jgi:hypothetical protein
VNKLFFDDVRDPLPNTGMWTLARDVKQAKYVINTFQSFDVMSLDHDIGMQMMCDKCYDEIPKPVTIDDTRLIEKLHTGCAHMEHGTDLARWMDENLLTWPRLIIIHSANPYGAERMAGILRKHTLVDVLPFHSIGYKLVAESFRG